MAAVSEEAFMTSPTLRPANIAFDNPMTIGRHSHDILTQTAT